MKAEPVDRPQLLHSRSQHSQQMSLDVRGPPQSGQKRVVEQVVAGRTECI
jgi:hypothetical protein